MNKYFLGIDTSAYTTSLGLIDENNNMLMDIRNVLEVKKDERGLRQQEALFQHINNIPSLIEKLSKNVDINKIDTIAVSIKPRNVIDSYMPVFVVGKNQAFILSKILKTQYKEFSHQEGHIGSCLINNENAIDTDEEFISLHISGGTSELLMVKNFKDNLKIDVIGGSLDISFGQLIDRIGVYLGFKFPCGKEMEILSNRGKLIDVKIPISIKDKYWTNLSGLENYFLKLIYSRNYPVEDIIYTLFYTISFIIEKLIRNSIESTNIKKVLFTGGISANSHIRKYLLNSFKEQANIIFPKIELSTDNAVGIAYLGMTRRGHGEVNG